MTHWTANVLADPAVLVRTITVTDEPAGNIVSWWKDDRRFLGYWLGRSYWGCGVGTEALRLFLQLEPTRPLWADPFAGNTGSVKLSTVSAEQARTGMVRTSTSYSYSTSGAPLNADREHTLHPLSVPFRQKMSVYGLQPLFDILVVAESGAAALAAHTVEIAFELVVGRELPVLNQPSHYR